MYFVVFVHLVKQEIFNNASLSLHHNQKNCPTLLKKKKRKERIQHNLHYIMLLLAIAAVNLSNFRLHDKAKKIKTVMKWERK